MKKRKKVSIWSDQVGMTLMEVLVSMGLVGVVFAALMSMLGQVGTFSSIFNNQAATVEGVAEAVNILNSVLPQTVRIQSCNCRSNSDTLAACIWDPNNAWYDPVRTGMAVSPVTILSGEFEAYDGNQGLTSMAGLAYSASFGGVACQPQASNLSTALQRGCRQAFSLVFTAPTQNTGNGTSKAGALTLNVGGSTKTVSIGAATETGAGGLGLTELSCGFDTSSGGTVGSTFVLNMRIKAKANLIRDVSHKSYESWYPGRTAIDQSTAATKNYLQGQFREIRLKFNFRNITTRGIYSWRPQVLRNCKENGVNATLPNQCCSQATDGTHCIECVRSGQAGTANSCCSGQTTSGALCI